MTEQGRRLRRTLDANMDVILRLFGFSGILVGFGEGVCGGARQSVSLHRYVRGHGQARIRGSGCWRAEGSGGQHKAGARPMGAVRIAGALWPADSGRRGGDSGDRQRTVGLEIFD